MTALPAESQPLPTLTDYLQRLYNRCISKQGKVLFIENSNKTFNWNSEVFMTSEFMIRLKTTTKTLIKPLDYLVQATNLKEESVGRSLASLLLNRLYVVGRSFVITSLS